MDSALEPESDDQAESFELEDLSSDQPVALTDEPKADVDEPDLSIAQGLPEEHIELDSTPELETELREDVPEELLELEIELEQPDQIETEASGFEPELQTLDTEDELELPELDIESLEPEVDSQPEPEPELETEVNPESALELEAITHELEDEAGLIEIAEPETNEVEPTAEFSLDDFEQEQEQEQDQDQDQDQDQEQELELELEQEEPEEEADDSVFSIEDDDFDIAELEAAAVIAPVEDSDSDESRQEDHGDAGEPVYELELEDDEFTLDDLSETDSVDAAPEAPALSELDLIFLEEAKENFSVVRTIIAEDSDAVNPDAVAAFHTLKGSAGMAEVPSIAHIAAPLESLLANLLGRSQPITDEVRALMSEGLDLMEAIAADLQQQREVAIHHEAFALKVSGLQQSTEESKPLFDFERVRKLGQAGPVLEEWQPTGMGALQVELAHVIEQAEPLALNSIVQLSGRLLEIYQKLSFKPDEATVATLHKAHEILVQMFDELASSQSIRSSAEAMALLQHIDLDRLLQGEAAARRLQPIDALFAEVARGIDRLSDGPVDTAVLQSKLSQIIEFEALDEPLVAVAELMLQMVEVFNEGQIELIECLANCRDEFARVTTVLRSGADAQANSDLLARCRGLLASRQDSTQAVGAVSEQADSPEVSPEEALPGGQLPEDEIDEDVLDLFLEEAEEISEAIDESILVWSGDTGSSEHLDNLLRHLHTLKGGARLAGLNSLGEFTHNFETYLISVQQNPVPMDDAFFALLNERQDEINRRIEIYNKLTRGEASADELDSMRHEMPVASSSAPIAEAEAPEENEASPDTLSLAKDLPEDDIDEDILPIFIEESEELVEAIDQCILDWSGDPQATEYYDDLLRHLHTLKGGARLAGINSLGEFAHNFETYLIGLERTPENLNEALFATLNQQQDEITRRVGVYSKMSQGEVSEADLASLAEAPSVPEPSVSVSATAAAEPHARVEQATTPSTAGSAGSQEMVRVSADLLEDLISMAGESNITRGRVEQQIRDFGDSLQEMEDTINRVRDQVRRLEIEAESRETVFRLANETREGDEGFDDLEMDRYTMIQEISRSLNESASDMLDLKETLTNKSRDAETLLHQQARIGTELQEGLTRTRMVPFARLIPRLRRIVRQISTEVGKSVRFDAFNVEGELDRSVLERIVAPLEHMLRNAVDHGIEDAEQRKANNKPETGRISLRLSREGGYVVLTISDDGGGINVDAVRRKAIERGVMTPDSNLSDHEVMQFIMHAGFSTAEKLTQISGRGVGMDVVNSEIKALGGSISIDSTLGRGSEFTIQIPFTVSINRALLVVVQEETYAVPLNTIEGIVRVSPYELEAYYQPDAPMFEYAGQPYRLAYMGRMLERGDDPVLEGQVAPLPVILARSGDSSVALQVDRVIGSREIVSKSLGPQFNDVTGVSGATVMGDGSVVVILDVLAFIRKSAEGVTAEQLEQAAEAEKLHKIRKVMIVDDSVTVRKVTSRLMERQGWEVTTAKDGLDAMNQLQDIYPDIVLLDIEMPKMDGFEVLKSVRGDPRLEKLPIIMITSRTGEKHKQQALELGVNQYLGKPFQENNLLSTIDEVLAAAGDSDG